MAVIEQERVLVERQEELAQPDLVLLEAAQLVRKKNDISAAGWCASNAIVRTTVNGGGVARFTDSHKRLLHSLGLRGEDGSYNVCHLFHWNDAEGRTPEEVATAMERAAWLTPREA